MSSPRVVLLMAGAGSRFRREGYEQSKPLIPVRGVPMFVHALASLGTAADVAEPVCVVRRQQVDEEGIDVIVREQVPGARFVVLESMTRGAAESALAASAVIERDDAVVVLDCDLGFRSAAYEQVLRAGHQEVDGAVVTFAATSANYSYARVDADDRILEVAEKRVISDRAIAGAYYFRSAGEFFDSARRETERGVVDGRELYLSNVLIDRLDAGRRLLACACDEYESFGTPTELTESLEAGAPK